MTHDDVRRQRFRNLCLSQTRISTPEEVVRRLGAVQAQEYPSARWAVAQRTTRATDADVGRICSEGGILRTHVMRPTWHFVLPEDIRWMLHLTAPRVNSSLAHRYRDLKIDDAVLARSHAVLVKALRGRTHLTRPELGAALRGAGVISPRDDPQRLTFIVLRAELDAVICSGPWIGSRLTYALLDERVPEPPRIDRNEARAELARRYFATHGPATIKDFMWWSGLSAGDARAGLDAVGSTLVSNAVDGKTYWRHKRIAPTGERERVAHLLTTWDEYSVAYRDRPPDEAAAWRQFPRDRGQTVVIDGRVAGTWRRVVERDSVTLQVTACSRFSRSDKDAVAVAVARYEQFLGVPVGVRFAG